MYKYKQVKDNAFVLSLDNHAEVSAALAAFCAEKGILAGNITGLGAVSEATFRFLDPHTLKYVDKTFAVTKLAFDAGVFINPVIPPACAPQDTLVRYALMATHTKEQVDESVEALSKVFRELEIIK